MAKIDPYDFNQEFLYDTRVEGNRYPVPEHEVLVSFNNDADAEMFDRWWTLRGKADFEEYFDENTDEYGNPLEDMYL